VTSVFVLALVLFDASPVDALADSPLTERSPRPPSDQFAKGRLIERDGARGIVVLVPRAWELQIVDGGGSGSQSIWRDPKDDKNVVTPTTGVSVGGWYETDGVTGSINPARLLPPGAVMQRVSNTQFNYTVAKDSAGYSRRGVWIAELRGSQPLGFRQLDIVSKGATAKQINYILNAFAETPLQPPSTAAPTPTTTTSLRTDGDRLTRLTATASTVLTAAYQGCGQVAVTNAGISAIDPTWAYARWTDVAKVPQCQGGWDYFRRQGETWIHVPGSSLRCNSWPADIGGFPGVMCVAG